MEGFEKLLNSDQLNQRIKSMGLSSQISDMLKAQEAITKSFSGHTMLTEIAKSIQNHGIFENPALSAIEAIAKSMNFQSKFIIPQTIFNAISSINLQHEQLFGNIRGLSEALSKSITAFSQINSWQLAVSGISGQVAAIAASQQKWDLIVDFAEITEEVVSLNERIFDEDGVTKEGLNELKDFFQRIEIKVEKIDADANVLLWKLLTLLSFILALFSEARNWLPKPEYATKQEVETIIIDQLAIFHQKLKGKNEFRIANRLCKVMSKPRLNSLVIEKLPVGFEVTVLQVYHKWVYVSYFDPKDNLPQTGWILKKYLDKPE